MANNKNLSETMRIDLIQDSFDTPSAIKKSPITAYPTAYHSQPKEEDFHSDLLKNIYDSAIVTDISGKIIKTNSRATKLLMYETFKIAELNVSDIIYGTDDNMLKDLSANLYHEKFIVIQAYCIKKDGSFFPAEITVNKLGKNIKKHLCFMIRDITIRKQTEDELKKEHTAIQNSANGIVMTNLELNIEYANPAFINIMNHDKNESLAESNICELFSDTKPIEEIVHALEEKDETWTGQLETVKKDGSEVYLQASATRIYDTNNELTGIVFSFIDITEQKIANKKLNSEKIKRKRLEGMSVLAAGIAHNFNNLLTSILGNTEMIIEDSDKSSSLHQNSEEILISAKLAAERCSQLMAYSGKERGFLAPLNLYETINCAKKLIKDSVPNNIEISFNLDDNTPAINGDDLLIRQIIMNLVNNAANSLKNEKGTISISTGTKECDEEYLKDAFLSENITPGKFVFFEITDTGCGIDENTKSKIFDPFFSLQFMGPGLGLAAALGIVRNHNGTLKVESELEKGSTFTILFPCTDLKHPEKETHVENIQDWSTSGTILLAENERLVRSITRKWLQRIGFDVLEANDGNEAIQLFKENSDIIKCVLLDMKMPQKDGIETCKELKKLNPDTPVILCSGYEEYDVKTHFELEHFSAFIHKPFESKTLKEKIYKVLLPDN